MIHKNHRIRCVEALEARITPASLPTFDFANLGNALGVEIVSPVGISGFDNIGDFNGDGVNDLLVYSVTANSNAGVAYLIYGRNYGFTGAINLSALDGVNGFSIAGEAAGDKFGRGAAAGDVNGDGYDDLVIGAPGANNGGTDRGSAYVIYGRPSTAATLPLSSLDGANGFKVTTVNNSDLLGFGVGGNGDFNGDGFDDVLIGAPTNDSFVSNGGAGYLIYGKAAPFAASIDVAALDGTNGFKIGTSEDEFLGTYVRFIGDLDRDGKDEIAIGESSRTPSLSGEMLTADLTFGDSNSSDSETGYVLYGAGSSPSQPFNISGIETSTTARGFIVSDTIKFQISSTARPIEDFTGDGIADFVIGSAKERNIGLTFVPGKAKQAFVENPLEKRGFKQFGRLFETSGSGTYGYSYGDFDGDNLPDFIIDKFNDTEAEFYFGRKLKGDSVLGKSKTDEGILFTGLSSTNAYTARFAGDVNDDGFDDIVATVPGEGGGERVFIVFGTGLRISPKGNSATFRDVDGDLVTVKTNKGTFDYAQFVTSRPDGAVDGGQQLDLINLANKPEFTGAKITVSVKKAGGGDGRVEIGHIDATGVDLSLVEVEGKLSEIDAGDTVAETPGLKKLDVLGLIQTTSSSAVNGAIGSIQVDGPWNATLQTTGGADAGIKSVKIKGDFSGSLQSAGRLGSFQTRDVADGSVISSATDGKPASLAFHKVGAANVAISGDIGVLKAAEIGEATISADRIASIVVSGDKKADLRGDFLGSVTLDNAGAAGSKIALGSVKIAGLAQGAAFSVAGSIGSFSVGAMVDSTIYAGFTPTNVSVPLEGGSFLADADIKALVVNGKVKSVTTALDNSFIVGASLGSVKIASIDSVNGGVTWGLGFQDKLKSLKVTEPAFVYDTQAGGSQNKDNFLVVDLV
jgi:hypothetical protein